MKDSFNGPWIDFQSPKIPTNVNFSVGKKLLKFKAVSRKDRSMIYPDLTYIWCNTANLFTYVKLNKMYSISPRTPHQILWPLSNPSWANIFHFGKFSAFLLKGLLLCLSAPWQFKYEERWEEGFLIPSWWRPRSPFVFRGFPQKVIVLWWNKLPKCYTSVELFCIRRIWEPSAISYNNIKQWAGTTKKRIVYPWCKWIQSHSKLSLLRGDKSDARRGGFWVLWSHMILNYVCVWKHQAPTSLRVFYRRSIEKPKLSTHSEEESGENWSYVHSCVYIPEQRGGPWPKSEG